MVPTSRIVSILAVEDGEGREDDVGGVETEVEAPVQAAISSRIREITIVQDAFSLMFML